MNTPGHWVTGSLLALLSAATFALGDVAVRLAADHVSVWHMMFARCLVGLLAMIVIARVAHLNIGGTNRRAMMLTGILNVAGVVCLMIALMVLPLFDALVLLYLYPAFAALFSPYLTQDPIDGGDWVLIGVAFGGTVLVLWSGHLSRALQWGHLFGLCAALGQGLTFTLIRRYSADHHPLTPFFYFCLVGTLCCFWPLLAQPDPWRVSSTGIINLAAIVVLAGAAQVIMYKALALLPSPDAGIISMTEVVFGGVLGYLIFSEPLTWRVTLGAACIIGSGIGLNIRGRRRNVKASVRQNAEA